MKVPILFAATLLLSPVHAEEAAPAAPVSAFAAAREKAQGNVCVNNAKQLTVGLMAWLLDNDDKFPATLEALKEGHLVELEKVTICPFDPNRQPGGYEFLLAGKTLSKIPEPATTPMLRAKFTSSDGRRTVAFADGHVERVKDAAKK